MLAYRPYCKLSLGAGLQLQYIKARLRNSTLVKNPATGGIIPGVEDRASLEGDTFDIGYTLCMNTATKPVSVSVTAVRSNIS